MIASFHSKRPRRNLVWLWCTIALSEMVARFLYRYVFKRTSTFVLGIVVTSMFFERAYDHVCEEIFEWVNEGVRCWFHYPHIYKVPCARMLISFTRISAFGVKKIGVYIFSSHKFLLHLSSFSIIKFRLVIYISYTCVWISVITRLREPRELFKYLNCFFLAEALDAYKAQIRRPHTRARRRKVIQFAERAWKS